MLFFYKLRLRSDGYEIRAGIFLLIEFNRNVAKPHVFKIRTDFKSGKIARHPVSV